MSPLKASSSRYCDGGVMQRWYVFCAEKAIASAKQAERVASHDEFSHGRRKLS